MNLAAGHCLLRLRSDGRLTLTYKEPHADPALGSRFKAKQESELELSDLETMRHILHRLGFTSERVYEKYREHFTHPDGSAAELDRLPHMGHFLELEADPERIERIAAQLGLELTDGLRENYFALFTDHCRQTGLDCRDLKFEDEKKS
jgi:predicted adenylyl cyclase CyaB